MVRRSSTDGHDDLQTGRDWPTTADATDGGAGPLHPTVAFDALSRARDRCVLYVLDECGGTVDREELATFVAAWTNDVRPTAVSESMARRAEKLLVHTGVPKLDAANLVTSVDGTVALTGAGRRLRPYLDVARRGEDRDVEAFLDAIR